MTEEDDDDDDDDDVTSANSSSFLAQESIRPKANAKIVGKKSDFSFFIEPQVCAGKIIIYSN